MAVSQLVERKLNGRTQALKRKALEVAPRVCLERGRIATKVYQETEGLPQVIRVAKVFERVVKEMSIFIQDGELIVGNVASSSRAGLLFPEATAIWVEEELDTFPTRDIDKFVVTDEAKRVIREEILPYYKGKTTEERARALMPKDTLALMDYEYPVFSPQNMLSNMVGHLIMDYEKVLRVGFKGIRKQVEEKLAALDLADPEAIEKRTFYEAELIVCDAVMEYARRYSELARSMAATERDPQRKKELMEIAEICSWVPANPARTFHEAVQSYCFAHLLGHFETDAQAISSGRFDYIVGPYYEHDIARGVLTREKALEIVECFFIKHFEMNHLFDYECAKYFGGYSITENLIIGGQDLEGRDSTNELSYICCEAEANMKLTQPAFSIRIHEGTPHDLFMNAAKVVRMGGGKPAFYNDKLHIPLLLSDGVELKDARNYGIVGCVEPTSIGNTYGWSNASMFNLAKCLELALNNGVCALTGKRIGPETGDPREFTSFAQVMEAFRKQVAFFVKHMVIALNAIDIAQAEVMPLPYLSLVVDDCIEKGKDLASGGARYNYTGVQGVGIADVADSLSAIKKLVFDEKTITMGELLEACWSDFEGKEPLRQLLINRAPKYGNDDDYVDLLASEVGRIYCEVVKQYRNPRGGHYRPALYPVSANVPLGARVAALPSGRKARVPLADGIAPTHGSDKKGPSAVLRSAAKLDHIKATNGTQLNQKFNPTVLATDEAMERFVNLIRGYFDLGGAHVQFNVVSADTLRDAQKHPERYRDLLVRVAGYSAFFVELDKSIQDDIIGRTEHMTV